MLIYFCSLLLLDENTGTVQQITTLGLFLPFK